MVKKKKSLAGNKIKRLSLSPWGAFRKVAPLAADTGAFSEIWPVTGPACHHLSPTQISCNPIPYTSAKAFWFSVKPHGNSHNSQQCKQVIQTRANFDQLHLYSNVQKLGHYWHIRDSRGQETGLKLEGFMYGFAITQLFPLRMPWGFFRGYLERAIDPRFNIKS